MSEDLISMWSARFGVPVDVRLSSALAETDLPSAERFFGLVNAVLTKVYQCMLTTQDTAAGLGWNPKGEKPVVAIAQIQDDQVLVECAFHCELAPEIQEIQAACPPPPVNDL